MIIGESLQVIRHRTLCRLERGEYAASQRSCCPHLVLPRNEILPLGGQETNDLLIPSRFTKPLENLGISTRAVVDNQQWHEGLLYRVDE